MLKKFISAAALGLALTACDDTCTEVSTMNDNQTQLEGNFTPNTQDENDLQKVAGDRVHFAFDSANINSKGKETLKRQADWLTSHSEKIATIEGHCDERGTEEYNLALGGKRADSVKEHLINMGVDSNRIKTHSWGTKHPAVDEHNESAYAQNRRAVTLVD